jgi:hypothetical protein
VDEAADREEPLASLLTIARALDSIGVPYMVTGSVASFVYGLARFTHDLDVVVRMELGNLPSLIDALGDAWFVDSESAEAALTSRLQFNIISRETGFKVDFWPLTGDPFDQSRFSRRRAQKVKDAHVFVPSPEDVILGKLDWYRQAPIERHLDDAREVYESFASDLDRSYLVLWAERLGITDLLEKLGRV